MGLTPGTRVGPYEIVSPLGAGGMGEVYRARDLKLDRDVALKILPDTFAADPDRVRRFEREAKTLASLNHPNIAQIYGIESFGANGTALVMELVPGPTLDELIRDQFERRGGSFEMSEVVAMASSIAEALEAAHDLGIVHRDLKPANIKIKGAWGPTPAHLTDGRLAPTRSASGIADGTVKLLDFGLARAVDPSGSADLAAAASSPTMLSPAATQQGIILGTAGYMSPEQAKGRTVDKRADIWAFGVVLYEMLTGKRLFGGESVTEIIASVIKDAPDLRALPPDTPPAIRQLLTRCLERDPKLRLRDIGEARILLQRANDPAYAAVQGASDPSGQGSLTPSSSQASSASRLRRLAGIAGAIVLAGISAAVAWNAKPVSGEPPVRRFDFSAAIARTTDFAVAPDGSRLAYLLDGHLYVRNLSRAESTDLGQVPPASDTLFFSHDGQRIAYSAESTLRSVPVDGGSTFTICKLPARGRLMDGIWLADGTIYVTAWRDSLYKVPAAGGTPALAASINSDTEIDFHSVTALPDNRLIVITHLRAQDAPRLDLVDAGQRTPITGDLAIGRAQFRPPNHLLFDRTGANAGVWMAPFDDGRLDLARAVSIEPGASSFHASFEGTLVSHLPSKERRDLVWIDFGRLGSGPSDDGSIRSVSSMRGAPFESTSSSVMLSPDGRRALVEARSKTGQEEMLIRDLATGTDTRVPPPLAPTGVTTGGRVNWTPGGRLLYPSGGVETSQIYDWPSDGSANGRVLVPGIVARITPDGHEVIFMRDDRSGVRLYRAPLLADGSAGKAELLFTGPDQPNVRGFDLSTDGHLLAFTMADPITSQADIFVTTYPELRQRQQVTSQGGTQPRFSRDGRQLFYLTGTRTPAAGLTQGELRVVPITATPLTVGASRVLMSAAATPGAPSVGGFDIASDGRLLMTRIAPTAPGDEARLVLLQNWIGAIKK